MTVRLVPVSAERFPAWLERSRAEYESDLIRSGEEPLEASRRTAESLQVAFPDGAPSRTMLSLTPWTTAVHSSATSGSVGTALAVFAPMSIASMALFTGAFAWVLTRPLIEPVYRAVLIPGLGTFGVMFGLWRSGMG